MTNQHCEHAIQIVYRDKSQAQAAMGKQTVVLGITATAAALSAAVMLYMRRKRKPADVPEGYEKIALHETEQMAGLILNPAVGTFTFYTGSMEVYL